MNEYEINERIAQNERHFYSLSAQCQRTSGYWLLATMIGLGYCLLHPSGLTLNFHFALALISYAGCIGIVIFWNLDTGVYHRLLNASYAEGLKLETQCPGIPQIRHNLKAMHAGRGVQPRVNWFYNVPLMILVTISTWCLGQYIHPVGWQVWALWIGTAFIYGMVSYYIRNESTVNLRNRSDKK